MAKRTDTWFEVVFKCFERVIIKLVLIVVAVYCFSQFTLKSTTVNDKHLSFTKYSIEKKNNSWLENVGSIADGTAGIANSVKRLVRK